ncbi:MAG TPA: amino acid adenylation domain-containing protein, partial [Thermoanaerobaculia bacterium]|nr:amino acid adenylation domain-containing protein [Thermoanaerobaculia bacterium]
MTQMQDKLANLSPAEKAAMFALLRKRKQAESTPDRIERRDPDASAPSAPLSFGQLRLWFLDRLMPGDAVYNVPSALRIRGVLHVPFLSLALAGVADRHEALRTTFMATEGGEPVQVIAPRFEPRLPLIDLGALPAGLHEAEMRRWVGVECRLPFDLERGPLLRACVFRSADDVHLLLLVMHHIVSDGWSMGVLVKEVGALYTAFVAGRPSPLPELPIQYSDFAAWQRRRLSGELLETEIAWWRSRLAGMPPALDLPADRPRTATRGSRGAVKGFRLGKEELAGLMAVARRSEATLFMVLLSAFFALVQRITGVDDLVVGTPIAGRMRSETSPLIGFFVNTLALRADLSGDPSLGEIVRRVRETTLSAYAHQELPFERLVGELAPERDMSRTPLVQVLFTLENSRPSSMEQPGLVLTPAAAETGTAKFELVCSLAETRLGLHGTFDYSVDLFDGTTMARLTAYFTRLLEAMGSNPAGLSELPLLAAGERHQILAEWNDTAEAYRTAGETCLHELIAGQAERSPEAVAVSFDGLAGADLTYRELLRRARRLADHLAALGVAPDSRVGVLLERSPEMIVGLLGVMTAGAAYVPLDPTLPAERLAALVGGARPAVILTRERSRDLVPAGAARTVMLDAEWSAIEQAPAGIRRRITGGNLAYVLYTSGSTGVPKGVMIPHRGIVNRLLWMQETYRLTAADRVLQKTPFGFDVSLWEFFWPLLTGARLVFAKPEGHKDPLYLLDVIRREGITTLHFVPSMLEAFLDAPGLEELASLRRLRRVLASGEALSPQLVRRFQERIGNPGQVELHNLYGPTEASVDVSFWPCPADPSVVPIGRPIANHRLHVVDRTLRPQPIGVAGELLLAGPGLARGYLGQPDLTAAVFVPDPFGAPGERLYRTGDLVRQLADGTVQYLGRTDQQVKIRGFRIELGEIETALAALPGVRAAAVLAQGDGQQRRLAAYLVVEAGRPVEELREALRGRLPEHMVPTAWAVLDALPLLSSGKVDRRALGRIDAAAGMGAATPVTSLSSLPRTPVEEMIAAVWSEVLERDGIGIRTHFFDLGGHSLLATRLASRLRAALGIELPLRTLFDHPTVAGQAAAAEAILRGGAGSTGSVGGHRAVAPPIVRAPHAPEGPAAEVPLSFAQQRLWFLDQLEPDSASYNIPFALRLRGAVDIPALRACLDEIYRRHEPLRARFGTLGTLAGQPAQRIADAAPVAVPVVDLAALPAARGDAEAHRIAAEESLRPFDLAAGPLLRAVLLRLEATAHVALFTMHHIAGDGWSTGVLVQELGVLYSGGTLPELPVRYSDFARWQRERLSGEALAEQLAYWRRRLAGAPPVLNLPLDRPRSGAAGAARGGGGVREMMLPASVHGALAALGRRHGVTLFMGLLAGFSALLARLSGQNDVTVGTPIANRNRAEIEGLIGFFVNTLVLRADLGRETAPSFRALLAQVRDSTLSAYAYQDLPFERLVEELSPERSFAHTPLFQVMFILQNAPFRPLDLPGLTVAPFGLPPAPAKFDLTFQVIEQGGALAASMTFRRDLFDAATIDRLLARLVRLLGAALAAPEARLAELPLLSAIETAQLLAEWNDTARRLPDVLLAELVAAQALRTPGAVAVEGADADDADAGALTYAELLRRSRGLAARLQAVGVGPEVPVGIALERSPEMLVALLGTLTAGGAYVPLDLDLPRERLAVLLAGARPAVVLTRRSLAAELPPGAGRRIFLDEEDLTAAGEPVPARALGAGAQSLASILYTSGSTGTPKGVMSCQGGLVNRLLWAQERLPLTPEDRLLQSAAFGFDFAFWEFMAPLLVGARVVLARPGGHRDGAYLARLIAERGVTVAHFVPSMLRVVLDELEEDWVERCASSLRMVLSGGEALTADLRQRFFDTLGEGVELHNEYGPTEASIDVTHHRCRPDDPAGVGAPLGYPIANTRLYVTERSLRPVPPGVTGELLLGGAGPARGYLGRPDLTAEAFIPDPFGAGPGGRLYRTGDLARQRADGLLEILGRTDQQVKIRGFRIEPGEIEAALETLPGVRTAAVVVQGQGGGRRLAAFVAVREGTTVADIAVLRGALRGRLPEHMVPAVWMLLPGLPTLPSGKIDRAALSRLEPEAAGSSAETAPQTPIEELVAGIWAGVLGRSAVGVHDDFFDLGGHSLLATQVVSRLRGALGVELPLRTLFDHPTVAGLAAAVDAALRLLQAGVLPAAPSFAAAGMGGVGAAGDAPLSFAQQPLWFLDQLAPGSPAYNIPTGVRLLGSLDIAALAASLGEIVRRHEVLRTRFRAVNGQPVQIVAPAERIVLPLADLTGLPAAVRDAEVHRLAGAEAARPFDLAAGPLLRAVLLRLGAAEHAALFTLHHIVSDAWSSGVLLRELGALYRACAAGEPSPLPSLPMQYADFARWQRAWLTGGVLETQLAYWRTLLAGAPAELALPFDRPRPAVPGDQGGHRLSILPGGLTAALATFSRRSSITLFMALLAGFEALLARVTGQHDFTLGTPVANRNRAETEGLIGFFVNTLVLRAAAAPAATFQALAERVRESTLQAYAHQDLPFERLVEELAPERSLGRTPLFQVMFTLLNAPARSLELPGVTLEPLPASSELARFDLSVTLAESPAGLAAGIAFRRDLFDAPTLGRLLASYEVLLRAAVAAPGTRLGDLPLLTEAETAQVLREPNDSRRPLPDLLVHELFAAQAARTPAAVAVEFESGEAGEVAELTYGDLARRAGALAARLRGFGVGPEVPVGIALERSPEMLVAVLGTLAAGGAFVPLDPDLPRERLAALLAGARPAVVVTRRTILAELPPVTGQALLIEELDPAVFLDLAVRVAGAGPQSLASILYTSGSTGEPKGVMSCHGGLVNRLLWSQETYPLRAADRVLHSAAFGFDFALWEQVAPLLAGARVVLARPGGHRDSAYLAALIARRGVTVAHFVPSLLRMFVEDGEVEGCALRLLLSGGEALTGELRERAFARLPGIQLYNQYGPTEASIDVTHQICRPGDGAAVEPLGGPVANTRLYLADPGLSAVPLGVPGELCLAGPALARGYAGRPDLTAERFVPDPFGGEPGERLYRTGDLARRRAEGALEILGRIDHQVKIRGVRVEPGEVEAALEALPGVRSAAVVSAGEGAERRLVACVVAADAAPNDLRDALRRRLPDAMIPAGWIVLPALPLLPSGKVDRKALQRLADEAGAGAATGSGAGGALRSPVEELVAEIWGAVLGRASLGAGDDFFALGGHSLLATQVISRVREAFGAEVPLRALFEAPTVAGFAAAVEAARRTGAGVTVPPIVPAVRTAAGLPLSFAQQRLWFLHRLAPDLPFYNIYGAYRLSGPLDIAVLRRVFSEIVRRHESLRTTFPAEGGKPLQRIAPPAPVPVPVIDLAALPGAARRSELGRISRAEGRHPFDVTREPLLRVHLVRLGAGEQSLLLNLHHIVSDGWSTGILHRELTALYAAYVSDPAALSSPLPELPLQYADFAVWQRGWLSGEALETQLAYWRRQLAGVPDSLALPFDRPRPAFETFRGLSEALLLPADLARGLAGLTRRLGATPSMTLLGGFKALLARHTGQDDFAVGVAVANRNRREIEGLIGFFVNTLVLRTRLDDLDGSPGFAALLGRVRDTALDAYMHQDLPFEKLVEELAPDRHLGRNPLFQTMLVLQRLPPPPALPGVEVEMLDVDTGTAKFDLTLMLVE